MAVRHLGFIDVPARTKAGGFDHAAVHKRALPAASPDDDQVLAHGITLFDGLDVTTSRKA